MKKIAEYNACMQRMSKAQTAIEGLLNDSTLLEKLSDETMGDIEYACEWLEIALDGIEKEKRQHEQ